MFKETIKEETWEYKDKKFIIKLLKDSFGGYEIRTSEKEGKELGIRVNLSGFDILDIEMAKGVKLDEVFDMLVKAVKQIIEVGFDKIEDMKT